MNITFETAEIKHLKEIQELNLKLFQKEHKDFDSSLNLNWTFGKSGTKYFKEKITEDDSCAFIAIENNMIVGYLCGGLTEAEDYRKLPLAADLSDTFVLEEFRSKGIGKKLYNMFIEWCKMKNISKIRTEASAQNEGAISFYKNKGFKEFSLILETDL